MTLEQSIKASFELDKDKFQSFLSLNDYDLYMLAYCRGIEYMTAKNNEELNALADRIGLTEKQPL